MNDIKPLLKLKSLLANIKRNYPKVKIDLTYNLINESCLLFVKYGKNKAATVCDNIAVCLLCLNYLYNAHFSGLAIKSISKKKIHKRKIDLFYFWAKNSVLWKEQEHKTAGDLWEMFEEHRAEEEKAHAERWEDATEQQQHTPAEEQERERDTTGHAEQAQI